MDTFPPETDALFARAAHFARDVVAPRAPDWERARRVPRDAIEAAAALGLCGVETPLAHGGPGLPFTAKARLCELLAAADFAFAFSLVNTGNIANKLAREASPEVIARWVPPLLAGRAIGCTALTEPGAGSDFAAITTRATRVDGGWRLDGEKAWIANAAEADVAVVYVQTEPGSGARGVAGFVVEAARAGFVRRPAFQLAGQHAIGTGGFALDGYLATDAELLQPPGRAFKAAMASINGARTYVAAMACGMVGEALRIAQDYGESRTTLGCRSPITRAGAGRSPRRRPNSPRRAGWWPRRPSASWPATTLSSSRRRPSSSRPAAPSACCRAWRRRWAPRGCARSIRSGGTCRRLGSRRSSTARPRCCWSGSPR